MRNEKKERGRLIHAANTLLRYMKHSKKCITPIALARFDGKRIFQPEGKIYVDWPQFDF